MITRQFSKFVVIGVVSTIINYIVFLLLLNYLNMNYLASSTIGFFAGVFAGFSFNRNWTFQVNERNTAQLLKYYLVYSLSLLLGLVTLRILVDSFGIPPQYANVAMICQTTLTNFGGTKWYVFKT